MAVLLGHLRGLNPRMIAREEQPLGTRPREPAGLLATEHIVGEKAAIFGCCCGQDES